VENVNQRFFEVIPKVLHVFCRYISVYRVLRDTIAASKI
jgi:phage gp36-like protein